MFKVNQCYMLTWSKLESMMPIRSICTQRLGHPRNRELLVMAIGSSKDCGVVIESTIPTWTYHGAHRQEMANISTRKVVMCDTFLFVCRGYTGPPASNLNVWCLLFVTTVVHLAFFPCHFNTSCVCMSVHLHVACQQVCSNVYAPETPWRTSVRSPAA